MHSRSTIKDPSIIHCMEIIRETEEEVVDEEAMEEVEDQ
jgi:hypothetical protein